MRLTDTLNMNLLLDKMFGVKERAELLLWYQNKGDALFLLSSLLVILPFLNET